ncbi:hypothetical protein ACFWJW_13105 [Streptomyces sp. NPDC127097]|uniref:hypothetical protein n=1 Tax=Streptomyces sp. NPDC127097 TaxID=3347136 RepID=UPI0036584212
MAWETAGRLAALQLGGRLEITITGTGLVLTAGKTDDSGAVGRTEWDQAAFAVTQDRRGCPSTLNGCSPPSASEAATNPSSRL